MGISVCVCILMLEIAAYFFLGHCGIDLDLSSIKNVC